MRVRTRGDAWFSRGGREPSSSRQRTARADARDHPCRTISSWRVKYRPRPKRASRPLLPRPAVARLSCAGMHPERADYLPVPGVRKSQRDLRAPLAIAKRAQPLAGGSAPRGHSCGASLTLERISDMRTPINRLHPRPLHQTAPRSKVHRACTRMPTRSHQSAARPHPEIS